MMNVMPPIIHRYLYCQTYNRIFDKVMYNRMKNFKEKHDMLNPLQYGFCKAYATHHVIILTLLKPFRLIWTNACLHVEFLLT